MSEKYRGGTGAAKLSYQFSSPTGGLVEIKSSGQPVIDLASTFGLWVYGDASNNSLELHFAPNDQTISVGSIFWRGWRFLRYPVSTLSGNNRLLTSIVVKQSGGYSAESKLYFDEIQTDAGVLRIETNEHSVPTEFALFQNYPNPFNPSTEISFAVARTGMVTVSIYDVLGREVAMPINEVRQAGRYIVPFNASQLSSGIYFYTMKSSAFTQTRKMILSK